MFISFFLACLACYIVVTVIGLGLSNHFQKVVTKQAVLCFQKIQINLKQ